MKRCLKSCQGEADCNRDHIIILACTLTLQKLKVLLGHLVNCANKFLKVHLGLQMIKASNTAQLLRATLSLFVAAALTSMTTARCFTTCMARENRALSCSPVLRFTVLLWPPTERHRIKILDI